MSILPVGINNIPVQMEESFESAAIEKTRRPEESRQPNNTHDNVEISKAGRAKAEAMKTEKAAGQTDEDGSEKSKSFTIKDRSEGQNNNSDKEEAVDELKDTNSDIKKKKDELQEAKTAFFGSDEEQAEKIKEIKQDIDDLEDAKKELESKLSM